MANFVRYRDGCQPGRMLKIIRAEPAENYTVQFDVSVVKIFLNQCPDLAAVRESHMT